MQQSQQSGREQGVSQQGASGQEGSQTRGERYTIDAPKGAREPLGRRGSDQVGDDVGAQARNAPSLFEGRQNTAAPLGLGDVEDDLASFRTEGFSLLSGAAMRRLLVQAMGGALDEEAFAKSWNGMGLDLHMANKSTCRNRTFVTSVIPKPDGPVVRTEPVPHFQDKVFNTVNGGVDRDFMQTSPEVVRSLIWQAVMEFFRKFCEAHFKHRVWWIEGHQFRISASEKEVGEPTPEGMHRDGVTCGLVMLIDRVNVRGGVTRIETPDGRLVREFTLTERFETLLLDDEACRHGVSSIVPIDPSKPAYRDTLVITFRALP